MSNEFAIQGNVHRLLRQLDVTPDSGQAAAFVEQLAKNVTPFVFTQVSAHNAKRKIAEFSPKPEAFLSKYEELKARSVRGLDPLIQLLSLIVSTKGMPNKLAPKSPSIHLSINPDMSSRTSESGSMQTRMRMSEKDIASIRENLLRDKDGVNRALSSSGNFTASAESKRQKLKTALVKRNAYVPSLPAWCHEQGLISRDFVPVSRAQIASYDVGGRGGGAKNEVEIGNMSMARQEALVCNDLVCLMSGISGKYIKCKDLSSGMMDASSATGVERREFVIDSSVDPSLVTFIHRFLPLFVNYSAVVRFIEDKSAFEYGQVNHALCAALRSLLKEYLVFVAQVEREKNRQQLQMQRLWHLTQPTMQTLHLMANIIADINKAGYTGGEVLTVLHSYVINSIKDARSQELCLFLAQAASRPFLDILQDWIYKGQINDPLFDFMIEQKQGTTLDEESIKYGAKDALTVDYWEKYYVQVPKNTPVFLDDLRDIILNTGKYLNVVRLYGQQFSFPKAKEILYTKHTKNYRDILEQAYNFASKLLLDLLIEKEGLKSRLISAKQYFLMGQGDFFLQFMTMAASELKKQVSDIVPAKLENMLELSMRTSSANSDLYKDDVRTVLLPYDYVTQLHKILAIETEHESQSSVSSGTELNLSGLEAFSITMDVKWPVNLVINQKAIARYQMLFRHIFYIKNVERLLCSVWVDNKACISSGRGGGGGGYSKWMAKMFLLRDKMMGFVKNLEIYIMFDVIEPHWDKLQKVLVDISDVELLLRTHSDFLDHCLKDCMLTTPDLLSFVSKLLVVCVNFSNAIRRLTRSAKIQQQHLTLPNESSQKKQPIAEQQMKGPNIDHVINTFNKNFNKLFNQFLDRLNYYEKREGELSMINVISRLDYNGYYSDLLMKAKERKLMNRAVNAATTANSSNLNSND